MRAYFIPPKEEWDFNNLLHSSSGVTEAFLCQEVYVTIQAKRETRVS